MRLQYHKYFRLEALKHCVGRGIVKQGTNYKLLQSFYSYAIKWVVLIKILLCLPAFAATNPQTQQLKQVDQQINQTQLQLKSTHKSATELTEKLKNIELAAGELAKKIAFLDIKIAPQTTLLSVLKQREQQLKKNLSSQQKMLSNILQSAYINHQKTYLKLLLNQESPQQLSRMSSYYQAYSTAQIQFITKLRATLTALHDTQEKITAQVTKLTSLRSTRLSEQKKLVNLCQQRQALLIELKKKIKLQQQKLNQLIENKHNLEKLINRLNPCKFTKKTKIAISQGHLCWPTNGKIISQFGSKQTPQSLPEQGVFISAPLGQAIKAIADGKVIYADWLKGFGLLLIIDHNKGFMSLYSHCNSLYNKVGDLISTGDTIATTGNSGGFQETGLMFELRHNGKPFDPFQWCKSKA